MSVDGLGNMGTDVGGVVGLDMQDVGISVGVDGVCVTGVDMSVGGVGMGTGIV